MPDILGMTENEARAVVRAAGLQLIVASPSAMKHPSPGSSGTWPIRMQIPTAGTGRNVDDVVAASYDPLMGHWDAGGMAPPKTDPSGPLVDAGVLNPDQEPK